MSWLSSLDWKKTLGSVAPTLATALGGPLAGQAVSAIQSALGLGSDTNEAAVSAAVTGATPEQLLALKNADYSFQEAMANIGVQLVQTDEKDRESARNREVATKDKLPAVMACFIVLGFMGALAYLLVNPTEVSQVGMVLVGALGAALTQVLNYYFGSSSGSDRKTELLGGIASQPDSAALASGYKSSSSSMNAASST